LAELRDKPAGTIRIVASGYAIKNVLWPKVREFVLQYPDINIDLVLDNGLTDIVSERFDAGVRMGEHLAKDMISARIGPDFCLAVVGSTDYFKKRDLPSHPKDLIQHTCVNFRLPSLGGFYAWEFEEDGREIKVRVEGQLAFNNTYDILQAVLEGYGLAYTLKKSSCLTWRTVDLFACCSPIHRIGMAFTSTIQAAGSLPPLLRLS
jgi:DNA-binding transcriptional LysR family regulator